VQLQAALKDGTNQSRLVALVQLHKPAMGPQGLLSSLVAETASTDNGKELLSREGSEAALERTMKIVSQTGALSEQKAVVPGLALGGVSCA
jgi:hypothetical protein